MVNIFQKGNIAANAPKGERDRNSTTSPVYDYIVQRLLAVCGEMQASDVYAISYLEMLYQRVMNDFRIPASQRSLLCILDKLEEDLQYSTEIFGPRAAFILDFLEADTLKQATGKSANEMEHRVLGKILWIRRTYLPQEEDKSKELLKPAEMKAYLDQFIIGQDEAKRAICTAVYGHAKRVRHPEVKFAPDIVLLIGPSGCGKTEIMRRIREITDDPMVFTDVSNLGASQYRGRHKEDILLDLYGQAGGKKAIAERGIIFMDEFDKLLLPAISERGVNMHDDVQSQLLTMLEGSEVELRDGRQSFLLDTSRILFVLAGAFQGIDEYIRADQIEKKNIAGNIGFTAPLKKEMDLDFVRENINHEILMKYGMKRELAGRLASVTVLERLKREDLIRILTEPKDSLIERYRREIKLSGDAELEFTQEALEEIADMALDTGTGARALHSILAKALRRVLYDAPDSRMHGKIIIDKTAIKDGVTLAAPSDSGTGESLQSIIGNYAE